MAISSGFVKWCLMGSGASQSFLRPAYGLCCPLPWITVFIFKSFCGLSLCLCYCSWLTDSALHFFFSPPATLWFEVQFGCMTTGLKGWKSKTVDTSAIGLLQSHRCPPFMVFGLLSKNVPSIPIFCPLPFCFLVLVCFLLWFQLTPCSSNCNLLGTIQGDQEEALELMEHCWSAGKATPGWALERQSPENCVLRSSYC